jgi:TPR repeat protein
MPPIIDQPHQARNGTPAGHPCNLKNPRECEAQCTAGDADGCAGAGAFYAQVYARELTPASAGLARELYEKSCELGSRVGCFELGVFELDNQWNEERPTHVETAKKSFTRACDLGHGAACAKLGAMYQDWQLAGNDPRTSARYYTRACDAGDAHGCARLAGMLMSGTGVPKDIGKGVAMAKAACDDREATACHDYAYALEIGRGVTADATTAAEHYLKSCDLGEALGCVGLASLYEVGVAATPGHAGIVRDDARARALYARGAVMKGLTSIVAAAVLQAVYGQKVDQKDEELDYYPGFPALGKIWARACIGGLPRYCAFMGFSLVVHDETRSAGLDAIKDACHRNDAWSCFELTRLKLGP